MRVVVTGGKGAVGKPLVARLVKHGFDVKVVDRVEWTDLEGAEYVQCDLTEYSAVREVVRGIDSIIHLAAIPFPGGSPGEEIFRNNCTSTFNIFEAAAAEGIRRVALASSINALGYHYGNQDFPIQYFPIDEDHPIYTTDPYSFSKQITEEIAAYYWRREGITSFCLRLPGVFTATDEMKSRFKEWLPRAKAATQEWVDLPQNERLEKVRKLRLKLSELRTQRFMEKPYEVRKENGTDMSDPDVRLLGSITNFWAIIDAEDSAQAFEKCLIAPVEGSYPLFVNDDHNTAWVESETLVQVFFPDTQGRTYPLVGNEALVSIAKAWSLIGFEPEFSLSKWLSEEK